VLDTTPPVIEPPRLRLRAGALAAWPGIPVSVRWSATDALSGIDAASVSHDCGDGMAALASPEAVRVSVRAAARADESADVEGWVPAGVCRIRVAATDHAGNRAASRDGDGTQLELLDDSARALHWSGGWKVRPTGVVGRDVHRVKVTAARLSMRVSGSEVGIVATIGPDRGRLRVLLDDVKVGLIDLYAPSPATGRLVFVLPLPEGGPHLVTLFVMRKPHPASRAMVVDIDGVIVTRDVTE
jgi:hypothetical protein